jgi:hypothetical protein
LGSKPQGNITVATLHGGASMSGVALEHGSQPEGRCRADTPIGPAASWPAEWAPPFSKNGSHLRSLPQVTCTQGPLKGSGKHPTTTCGSSLDPPPNGAAKIEKAIQHGAAIHERPDRQSGRTAQGCKKAISATMPETLPCPYCQAPAGIPALRGSPDGPGTPWKRCSHCNMAYTD